MCVGKNFKIVSHKPGKVQLKLNPVQAKEAQKDHEANENVTKISPMQAQKFIKTLPGVESLKLNPFTATATVHYNTAICDPVFWECWMNTESNEELNAWINKALEDFTFE